MGVVWVRGLGWWAFRFGGGAGRFARARRSGTDAWSSTNGGRVYTSLPQPNEVSSTSGGTTGLAPGGGDTDLATAPVKNAARRYNVYVASLTLCSVTVRLSQHGGGTRGNHRPPPNGPRA